MRELILYIASSLDGFIARENGELDWLLPFQNVKGEDYGYQDFLQTVDTILMGRKTYEQVLGFGEFPYQDKQCFVFTRDEAENEDEYVQFVHKNIIAFVSSLKYAERSKIWLVGGAEIINKFVPLRLVDGYIISIIPILLGSGIPLFKPTSSEIELEFIMENAYPCGIVQLQYINKSH